MGNASGRDARGGVDSIHARGVVAIEQPVHPQAVTMQTPRQFRLGIDGT
jgi:hypothetical protein